MSPTNSVKKSLLIKRGKSTLNTSQYSGELLLIYSSLEHISLTSCLATFHKIFDKTNDNLLVIIMV